MLLGDIFITYTNKIGFSGTLAYKKEKTHFLVV